MTKTFTLPLDTSGARAVLRALQDKMLANSKVLDLIDQCQDAKNPCFRELRIDQNRLIGAINLLDDHLFYLDNGIPRPEPTDADAENHELDWPDRANQF